MFVDAAVGHEWEGVLHREPRAVVGLVVVGLLGFVEVVGLGGVGPPGIEAHVVEVREVLPVDVACLGIEGIVGQHALLARPRVEGQQGAYLLQFAVGLRPRAEAGPDGNHQVGIVLVDVLHHLLRTLQTGLQALGLVFGCHLLQVVGQVFLPGGVAHFINVIGILEAHGIPVGVATPVLPVLHDAVEGNLQLAVLVEHGGQLVAGLVALSALPMAHGPEGEHRGLSRQLAYAGDDGVLRAVAVDEVVVDARSHLAGEGRGVGVRLALEATLAGIVPVEAIAARRGEIRDGDVAVVVPQLHVASAPRHGLVAQLAEAVDVLVVLQRPLLADAVAACIRSAGQKFEAGCRCLAEQHLALPVRERHEPRGVIDAHPNVRILCGALSEDYRVALLRRCGTLAGILHDVYDVVAEIRGLDGHAIHAAAQGGSGLLLRFRCPGGGGDE